ncbi:MAG: hypothetical protein HFG28_04080 [Eubacterium sp.]|nr:hypothetical protein [Eubacterium sp.]
MEGFLSEHGGVLTSAIISIALLAVIFIVVSAVGNMEAYTIASISGME